MKFLARNLHHYPKLLSLSAFYLARRFAPHGGTDCTLKSYLKKTKFLRGTDEDEK